VSEWPLSFLSPELNNASMLQVEMIYPSNEKATCFVQMAFQKKC